MLIPDIRAVLVGGSEGSSQLQRWARTAATWFAKAVALAQWCDDNAHAHPDEEAARTLLSYQAARLLCDVLYQADSLVPLITDPDHLAECREHAQTLARLLRRAHLAPKLADTAGREPAEAAAFAAAAERKAP